MKKNIKIVLFLICMQVFAFYLNSHAQDTTFRGGHATALKDITPKDTFLLANETTMNYNKTEARIDCSNESVFNSLYKSHNQLFKRYTCTWKKDRHGRYKHYVIYLSKGDAETIYYWSKSHL